MSGVALLINHSWRLVLLLLLMVSWSETVSLDVRSSIVDQSLLETGITAAVNGVLVRDCFTGCQE